MAKLAFHNVATNIRKQLMIEVLKYYLSGKIHRMHEIPIQLYPKNQTPYRCCVYRDRAIVRSRMIAILGHSIEEEDETITLEEYASMAEEREKIQEPVLTVISEACSACVTHNYYITNACRGCVARPCTTNCPKKAITVKDHQAQIDAATCVSCGVCQKVCPYNAVVYVPIPCEDGCPVGAISKDGTGKESIDYTKCIYCGQCTRGCPFGAIVEKTQLIDVAKNMKSGSKMVAMVAPSIVGQYPGTFRQIIAAIKEAGFEKVVEVAVGADKCAQLEAHELEERLKAGDTHMGTSCCPAYTEAVKKHAQEFSKYVSHARTPMSYTAEMAAKQYPGHVRVFIGPCIAKKYEGICDDNVDYVLTYEELDAFFAAKNIETDKCGEADFDGEDATVYGKGFAISKGVSAAIQHYAKCIDIKPVLIDGLNKRGMNQLKAYGKQSAPGNLVEVMGCEGGCINGPGVSADPAKAAEKLKQMLREQGEPT